MASPIQGVPPTAQPWARGIEKSISKINNTLGLVTDTLAQPVDIDRAVFGNAYPENIPNGTVGRWNPVYPVSLRFVSSTGIYEVTVSLAGKVYDGALLGAGFESDAYPYAIDNDIPRKGVVGMAAPQAAYPAYMNFSYSRSTIVSARPGVQNLTLYYYVLNNATVNSLAYVQDAQLAIKAV